MRIGLVSGTLWLLAISTAGCSPPGGPESMPPTERPGLLAGLFVATADEVERLDVTALVPPTYPSVDADLTDVELATLEAILTGVEVGEIIDEMPSEVASGGDEGPWTIPVREELVEALRELDAADVDRTAREWADTEEWRRFGYSYDAPGDLVDILEGKRSLARETGNGRQMYLRVSL